MIFLRGVFSSDEGLVGTTQFCAVMWFLGFVAISIKAGWTGDVAMITALGTYAAGGGVGIVALGAGVGIREKLGQKSVTAAVQAPDGSAASLTTGG